MAMGINVQFNTAWNILKDVQGESRLGFQIREDQWSFIDFLHHTIYQCDLIVYEMLYDPLPKFPPFFCMTTILSIAIFSYQSSDERVCYELDWFQFVSGNSHFQHVSFSMHPEYLCFMTLNIAHFCTHFYVLISILTLMIMTLFRKTDFQTTQMEE